MAENFIELRNIFLGGISESRFAGSQNSVAMMSGVDVMSELGVIKNQKALVKESGNTITELCKVIIPCSDGNTYFFSSESGKIWKRTSGGVYSLLYTVVPADGEAKILGAKESNNYLYFSTQNYLHRIAVNQTSDFSGNVQLNWYRLSLMQDAMGGTGNQYTMPTSISELTSDIDEFVAGESQLNSIVIDVSTYTSGTITVTLHDSDNNVIGSKTFATPTAGRNEGSFTSPLALEIGKTYHFHYTSSVGTNKLTSVTVQATDVYAELYTACGTEHRPMVEVNNILYIGDRNYIHQVEDNVFSYWALDINRDSVISCLTAYGVQLAIGTVPATDIAQARFLVWNTWSVSYSYEDIVPESGINAFLDLDNGFVVQAGNKGRWYYYDGTGLVLFRQMNGDYNGKTMKMFANAGANLLGIPYFGLSNVSGNPTASGVWSFVAKNTSYPRIFNFDYKISKLLEANVTIGAMASRNGQLFVAWKWDNGTDPAEYGVDVIDTDYCLLSYIETRVMYVARFMETNFQKFGVGYVSLPTGTSIVMKYRKTFDGDWVTLGTKQDETRRVVEASESVQATALELRIELNAKSDGSATPVIDSIYVLPQ